ncbi:hypothetical protein RIF29_38111 [Crotalaria pallida]|uniref:Uncharacterized protein n=1 Tax=Crotalaria pallida TaxID=3830 RepID=A0AAN9HS15_CROPI
MSTTQQHLLVQVQDNIQLSDIEKRIFERLLATSTSLLSSALSVAGFVTSNPDRSKHLETARMRLFDMWIDFVNLRSEEYAENSRIPSKQSFGTPEEDAYRSSYNLETQSTGE